MVGALGYKWALYLFYICDSYIGLNVYSFYFLFGSIVVTCEYHSQN